MQDGSTAQTPSVLIPFFPLFCFPSAFSTWRLQEAMPGWSTDSNTSLLK